MRPLKICLAVITYILAAAECSPLFAGVYGPAPYQENLLTNPNANTGNLGGWTITANGGAGWAVDTEYFPDATEDNGFLTSYAWNTREQVVNLTALGFTPQYLDTQPAISVSEVFERVFCADYFFLQIDLLGQSGNIIHSWSSGDLQHSGTDCDYSGYKEKVATKLANYGTGVRFIRWRDGGKDSEYWQGHFGPKLQNAYLALAPANLLQNPGELSSWIVNPDHDFELTGPSQARQFRTSYRWSHRQQTIDLLARGFTAAQLDSGELPILAEGTYREMACPDEFFLRVELLDTNFAVLQTRDSGVQVHDGECDWTYSLYGETVNHRFDNYPPGVRYIRWTDGGKDREFWSGHFGAVLESPYLGLVNSLAWHSGEGRILEAWDYGLVSEADASATYTVPASQRLLSQMSAQATNPQTTACDGPCKMEKIRADLAPNGNATTGPLWELSSNNSKVEIFSSPEDKACPSTETDVDKCQLEKAGEEFLKAVRETIQNGKQQIDITTLSGISDWSGPTESFATAIRKALREVEREAAIHHRAPVVRIYIGIPAYTYGWETYLSDLLNNLTRNLVGGTNMTVYLAGGQRLDYISWTMNWNHSKIVAVDGREAIVGGHNLWHEYLRKNPVFDISMKVTGDSARSAHLFVDDLLRDHDRHNAAGMLIDNAWVWHNKIISKPSSSPIPVPLAPSSGGSIEVLGVGQLSTDQPSPLKTAVASLLSTAEQTIYISQQMLTHMYYGNTYYLPLENVDRNLARILAHKAIEKNVRISIILSNPDALWVPTSTNEWLLRELWTHSGLTDTKNGRERFCANVSVSYLRINDHHTTFPGTSEGFTNHAKSIMVDNQIFLIGSHNLYSQVPAQLSEYAYIVADTSTAQSFLRNYWVPVLHNSGKTGAVDKKACITAIEGAGFIDEL